MTALSRTNYVDRAEKTIKEIFKQRHRISSTQLRNLLGLIVPIFEESQHNSYEDLVDKISYLRVRIIYYSGQDRNVKDFVNKAQLIEAVKAIKDLDSLELFTRYMEALVAYYTYYDDRK